MGYDDACLGDCFQKSIAGKKMARIFQDPCTVVVLIPEADQAQIVCPTPI